MIVLPGITDVLNNVPRLSDGNVNYGSHLTKVAGANCAASTEECYTDERSGAKIFKI